MEEKNMEQENMEVVEQTTVEEADSAPQVETAAPQEEPLQEKKYTDEDVNRIIQKRLARERKKEEMKREHPDEYMKQLDEREAKILERELRYEAGRMRAEAESKDCIQPEGMLDYLDYSSEEAMKESFEKFQKLIIYPLNRAYLGAKYGNSTPKIGTGSGWSRDDEIKDAFRSIK
ncbi:MAG: hypothetical protein ACLTOT_15725 [Eubacterium callanderi]|uniref:hypothetical protein n=1 Tax=Eubacterium callanderi TaxID=53442 RepID=UPI002673BC4C|nr:hypothetical protein [Eubacterium callanderi]